MTLRLGHRPIHDNGAWIGPPPDAPRAHPSNRRRLVVFLATLIIALGVSLALVWLRPAEYRAAARVEIMPAVTAAPGAPSAPVLTLETESARPFLTELQILTSRPVVAEAAARLASAGENLTPLGLDPIAGIQSHLQAVPVEKTNVVELIATGPSAELLAPIVNTTIAVYRERLAQSYQTSSSEALADADDEVKRLESLVAAKRRELEAFRLRHNIVSLERGENQVLAQVRSLSTSLSAANEKVATAEGKLRALTESAAVGNAATRPRDDPTLGDLEQRVSQTRVELRDMERVYTQTFLANEPKAIALRTRLAELERQIQSLREASQKAALADAKEELAGATGAATRLQSQLTSGREEVGQFTARFNEYKSRTDDLTEIEKTFREATQKRARLEASERSRMPAANLIEVASAPREPWRPLYWRDTGIAAGASLVLALLAMFLVELFNRTQPQPTVMVVRQPSGMSYEGRLDAVTRQDVPLAPLGRVEPLLVAAQARLPRELDRDDVTGLLKASDDASRLVALLLLNGVTVDEAIGLRLGDVDSARGIIRIGGETGRDLVLGDALRAALGARASGGPADALLSQAGRAATREGIDAQILCAAHDAGLEDPASVTAESLRHTYVAYLVRQGIRFADLTSLVGELPAELLGAYTTFAPPGPRVAREQIQTTYPGVHSHVAG